MRLLFLFIISLVFSYQLVAQPKTGYLTKDGAWCWFSDPRAIMVDGKVVTGWVKTDVTVEAALFETKSKVI